jgi:hypothetical protein
MENDKKVEKTKLDVLIVGDLNSGKKTLASALMLNSMKNGFIKSFKMPASIGLTKSFETESRIYNMILPGKVWNSSHYRSSKKKESATNEHEFSRMFFATDLHISTQITVLRKKICENLWESVVAKFAFYGFSIRCWIVLRRSSSNS